ncbi:MAG: hypothetical protein JSS98_10585 [Bacteroidetes bacterium]|nr:hypothetical protein [Bacteroidota bacterium]
MKYSEFVKEMFPKLPAHLQAKDKIKEIAKLWREKKNNHTVSVHKRVHGGNLPVEENTQGEWLEVAGKGLRKRGRPSQQKAKAGDFIHDLTKLGKVAATGDIFGLGLQHKKDHHKESKKVLNEVVVALVHKGLKKHQKHKNIKCALEHVLHNGFDFNEFKAPY